MAGPLTQRILDVLPGPDLPEPPMLVGQHPLYYDREGYALTLSEWSKLFHCMEYRQVGWTEVGGFHVSTVWLGLDHGWGAGHLPIIFETMVFESEPSFKKPSEWFPDGFWYNRDFDQRRYCTEGQAQAGHETTVNELRTMIAAMPDPADLSVE